MYLDLYLKNRYGSKKGFLRFLYYGICSKYFGMFRRYRLPNYMVRRVIFVCKGNVCRSAIAEAFFKIVSSISCTSIGLEVQDGHKANSRISVVATKYNVSLDSHLTTSIDTFVALDGDLYICMEPNQIQSIHARLGDVPIVLLGSFGSGSIYIHDPYNANDQYMDACALDIFKAVTSLSKQLNTHLNDGA